MTTKMRPGQKLKLKSVEELLGVSNEESAMDIEIAKIRPFKDHPFKVVDDDKMTTVPGVFAAGDVVHGSMTVVHAVADAKIAAEAMIRYMEKGPKTE